MQRTNDEAVIDLARPAEGMPADVRGIETDERVAAAKREAASGAAVEIGLEDGTTKTSIALVRRWRAKLESYRSEDIRMQVVRKAGLEQQAGRYVDQLRLLAEELEHVVAETSRDVMVAKEAWPWVTASVEHLDPVRRGHVQTPDAVRQKTTERIGGTGLCAGGTVNVEEWSQDGLGFQVPDITRARVLQAPEGVKQQQRFVRRANVPSAEASDSPQVLEKFVCSQGCFTSAAVLAW